MSSRPRPGRRKTPGKDSARCVDLFRLRGVSHCNCGQRISILKSEVALDYKTFPPACHAGGRGFKSRLSRHYFNDLSFLDFPESVTETASVTISTAFCSRSSVRPRSLLTSTPRTAPNIFGEYVWYSELEDASVLAILLCNSWGLAPPSSASTLPERRKSAI